MKLKFLIIAILSITSSLVTFAASEPAASMSKETSQIKNEIKVTNGPVVNINTAQAKNFAGLKGIGKKRAEAIIAYRTEHGNFESVDALVNVKGISKKAVEQNRARLKV